MSKQDPDQQAVYYAERLVFEDTLYEEAVGDADIKALADELFGSDWWQANRIPVPTLHHRRLEALNSCANFYTSNRPPEIRFCAEQINAWILAHEASHIAQYHIWGTGTASHGVEFRSAYVTIAGILLGSTAATDLLNSFNRFLPGLEAQPNVPEAEKPDGIYQIWRARQAVDQLNRTIARQRAMDLHPSNQRPSTLTRINGAIPL